MILTKHQRRIAHLVAEGYSNKEIGKEFGVPEQTIKNMMVTIFRKLGVNNRIKVAILVARGEV